VSVEHHRALNWTNRSSGSYELTPVTQPRDRMAKSPIVMSTLENADDRRMKPAEDRGAVSRKMS
jgi:hypothetical protein